MIVLKYWLRDRGLNDTFTGGVGSFLLQLLVICSLQHPPPTPSHFRSHGGNLGASLIHFFELFGLRLNYTQVGIAVTDGGRFFNKRLRGCLDERRPYLLAVESPHDSSVDVASNAFNIRSVRRACEHAYCSLLAAAADAAKERSSSADKTQPRMRILSALLDGAEEEMAERFSLHQAECAAGVAPESAQASSAEASGVQSHSATSCDKQASVGPRKGRLEEGRASRKGPPSKGPSKRLRDEGTKKKKGVLKRVVSAVSQALTGKRKSK